MRLNGRIKADMVSTWWLGSAVLWIALSRVSGCVVQLNGRTNADAVSTWWLGPAVFSLPKQLPGARSAPTSPPPRVYVTGGGQLNGRTKAETISTWWLG